MQIMRVGVYPYSAEFDPFLRHISLLEPAFQISALISPAGWGLAEQTIKNESRNEEWTVMSVFEPVLCDIDTVFIPTFHVDEKVETLIIQEVESIVPQLKKLYVPPSYPQKIRKVFRRPVRSLAVYLKT